MWYCESPDMMPTVRTKSLFLAGGIVGCRDWQTQLIKELEHLDIIIYNPRRKDFSMDDPLAAHVQIAWEYHQMKKADAISFWFCEETICPIVLLEFGKWLETNKPIVVGMDEKYQRRQDVEIQLGLSRPEYKKMTSIKTTIPDFAKTIEFILSKLEK